MFINSPKSRWIILQTPITHNMQVVHLDEKIPAHCKELIGIKFSIRNFIDTNSDFIPHFGEASILINSSKIHLGNFNVCYFKSPLKKQNQFTVQEKLLINTLLSGYYKDLGYSLKQGSRQFIPYSVSIYLHCIN